MQLLNIDRPRLIDYTVSQTAHFFPDGKDDVRGAVECYCDEALDRFNYCLKAVRYWKTGGFDYLHSAQYCTYLYFLSNSIWRGTQDKAACTKLYLLNKTLNAIECSYETKLPEIFFIAHTVGIVLTKNATYGNYLVVHQNSTIGKTPRDEPVLEDGVVMYANTAIIGRCRVGANTVVSQGTGIVNKDTPGNNMVFRGSNGELIFKPNTRNILAEFFLL